MTTMTTASSSKTPSDADRNPHGRRLMLDGNTRVPVLLDMVKDLSHAAEPAQVLEAFSRGMVQIQEHRGYLSLSIRNAQPGAYKITRFTDDMNGGPLDDAAWRDPDQFPIHTGGFLGELIAEAAPAIYFDLHVPNDPVLGDALAPYRSLLAVPLYDGGEPLNWAIFLKRRPDGFDIIELEETIIRANLVGGTIRHVLTTKRLREANEHITREVDRIAQIQKALLPKELPNIPGLSLAASFATYDDAGGDLYDVFPIGSCKPHQPGATANTSPTTNPTAASPSNDAVWALLMFDVSGHGPGATTVSSMVYATVRTLLRQQQSPGEVLAGVNQLLCERSIEASFVTAVLAYYCPTTRSLTYARAGHPPIMLRQPGDGAQITALDAVGAFPLGVVPDVTYEHATVQLQPGQTLIFYTDGITEARNHQGVMFEEAGIASALKRCTGDPDCSVSTIRKALLHHEAGARPGDDQTLLVAQVTDAP